MKVRLTDWARDFLTHSKRLKAEITLKLKKWDNEGKNYDINRSTNEEISSNS